MWRMNGQKSTEKMERKVDGLYKKWIAEMDALPSADLPTNVFRLTEDPKRKAIENKYMRVLRRIKNGECKDECGDECEYDCEDEWAKEREKERERRKREESIRGKDDKKLREERERKETELHKKFLKELNGVSPDDASPICEKYIKLADKIRNR